MKQLIIGGGMAGLTTALVSAKLGNSVTVVERSSRVGKKIIMSGNGKCNLGNSNISPKFYNDNAVIGNVISRVPFSRYVNFWHSLGLLTFTDSEGRLYPISETSSSVVDILRFGIEKLGVEVLTDSQVAKLTNNKTHFTAEINGSQRVFDDVVLAVGSPSQAKETFAETLLPSSYFTPLVPSLVPVKVSNAEPVLQGIRVKANVSLISDSQQVAQESGEVLFKENGLSGICIFNLSAVIARNNVKGESHNYIFDIDLLPTLSESELTTILESKLSDSIAPSELFVGILHNKLAEVVLRRFTANLQSKSNCNVVLQSGNINKKEDSTTKGTTAKSYVLSSADMKSLAHIVKHFVFNFAKLLDFSMSQVTSGGIKTDLLSNSFALPCGVRAVGEVLDVDGVCGGYNLQFACSSALCLFTEDELAKIGI